MKKCKFMVAAVLLFVVPQVMTQNVSYKLIADLREFYDRHGSHYLIELKEAPMDAKDCKGISESRYAVVGWATGGMRHMETLGFGCWKAFGNNIAILYTDQISGEKIEIVRPKSAFKTAPYFKGWAYRDYP